MNANSRKIFFCILLFISNQQIVFAQHDTLKAKELLELGISHYEDGSYLKARVPLQEALSLRQKHYPQNHLFIEDVYYWLGTNEQGLRNNEKAIEYYQKGLAIAEKRTGPESVVVGDFYMDMGNTYDQMYDVDKARECYEKTLEIYKKAFGEKSAEVGNALMNIGYGQRKMGNYRECARYYEQAFQIFQKASEPTSKDFYRIYINQCNLLYDLGNYDQALDFAKKALEIKLIHYDTIHPSVYKYFNNIGRIYQAQNRYQEALPFLEKAYSIAEASRGKTHPETAGVLGELARVYADLDQDKKALKLHKRSVKIQEQGLPPTHPYLVAGYQDIGYTYKKMGRYNKAINFYQEAIEKYKKAVFIPKHLIAETKLLMAEAYFQKGDISRALVLIQEGLQNIASDFSFEENDFYKNPEIKQVQAEVAFLHLLQSKAYFLQSSFEKSNIKTDLEQALHTSELAITLIEKIRRSYQSEAARQFLNSDTAPIFEQAIEQAFELYRLTKDSKYLQKAFELSEKSKASILWQSINSQYALKASNIPKSLLDSLENLSQKINWLEEESGKLSKKEQDKAENQIFNLKLSYENIIRSLEKHNPSYYQLKYAPAEISVQEVMQTLPDKESALVSYFQSKDEIFIFSIRKGEISGFRKKLSYDLNKAIYRLRENDAQRSAFDPQSILEYIRTLDTLHETLVQPLSSSLSNIKKLILIPHGALHYLSFETLTDGNSSTNFKRLNYLITAYDIQYAWSAAFWASPPKRQSSLPIEFSGFAPSFQTDEKTAKTSLNAQRNILANLPHAISEVQAAKAFFKGQSFTNEAATKEKFIDLAPKSKIIHLATHGLINDHQPMESGLVFSNSIAPETDNFLSATEIYQLKLSADLAVMSACNTGYGQLAQGEGAMSLGRAFSYAGCRSVIMSLWPANDESSSTILKNFYQYAAQGLSKDRALRQAKIDYLKSADPLTAHPFFWANLVTVGDMSPLKLKPGFNFLWLILLLPLALLVYRLLKKEGKTST